MKKLTALFLAMFMALTLTACGGDTSQESAQETITITALNGNKEKTKIEVPYNPQRVAILDMAALDIIDNIGMGDRVVGSASTSLDYLQDYVTNENIANLGTIKEADMEAVMECDPDIIFIGGRLSSIYDDLSEIAPVVYLQTDSKLGVIESTKQNAQTIASIFGKEKEITEKMTDFDTRISALQEFAKDKTTVVGMATSGSYNLLGNDGRCSIIGNELGFENIGASATSEGQESGGSTATHGNETSFELIVDLNPDFMFVMDRDAAIGTDGAQLAKDIVENELVKQTDTYKNGHIIYLEHPAVWYTAEGGLTALDYMLKDLEAMLV